MYWIDWASIGGIALGCRSLIVRAQASIVAEEHRAVRRHSRFSVTIPSTVEKVMFGPVMSTVAAFFVLTKFAAVSVSQSS